MTQKANLRNVLLVDDDTEALAHYKRLLKRRCNANITTSRFPTEALRIASDHLFDAICLDVTMNYAGSSFGGLELYKALLGRYGNASLIAYSQFITDDLLKQYEYDFNFVERGQNTTTFINRLIASLNKLRRRQTCFVAMPFDKRHRELYRVIARAAVAAGYRCLRVDQQHFSASIIQRIVMELRRAKIIVVVATDRNPNVFYECGYAVALNKEVITVTDVFSNLPFDVRDRNSLAYGDSSSGFLTKLTNRLLGMSTSGNRI